MATTFIQYNNNGFWIHESFMQLAYHYIHAELIKPQYVLVGKNELLEKLQFHIDGYSTGSMSLGWYGIIQSPADKQTMVQVLQNTKSYLQNQGTLLSVLHLSNIPTEDDDFKKLFRRPFPTAELVKIIDALIQMINGTWNSDNYDMLINY